ncbi:hypothetical protein O3P69_017264 [Scylla paramamosain]|uniref:Uncharacterized protein n=1 Tax=Scylla paramamosain TaxID=85552 RepID=A0AAW0TZL1_SCYPA
MLVLRLLEERRADSAREQRDPGRKCGCGLREVRLFRDCPAETPPCVAPVCQNEEEEEENEEEKEKSEKGEKEEEEEKEKDVEEEERRKRMRRRREK